MEMHQLPFKPRTLTLAIAAVLVASQPATEVNAESLLSADEQWSCQVAPSGTGWQCTVKPVKQGVMQRAPRPAATTTHPVAKAAPSSQPKTVATTRARASLKNQLDWVPKEQLPEPQKAELTRETPWCKGNYVEPARPGLNYKGDPDAAPIVAEADESLYDEASVATLKGDITVRQGSRQLQADTAQMDRVKNYAEFEGNVVFREPGVLLVGDSGDMTLDTGRASIQSASYVIHDSHLRGSSSEIIRNEDTSLELNNATYTSCRPGDDGWELSGENVTLDPVTGFGTARNAVVRVQGLPVFYTPYIYFPIDDRRQSGFLYPSFGFGGDNGTEFSVPYYWNIAPNYDATITPRHMSKRGLSLENEFRYLGKSYEGEIGFAGLAGKDKLKKENRYYDEGRWLANFRHKQYFTERWTAEVDYADASDKGYLDDFGSFLNLSNTSPLNQHISTAYYGGSDTNNWQLSLDAHRLKNMSETSDDPYNKLPQLVLSGNWQPGSFNVSYLADYTYFSRDDKWNYVNEITDPTFNDPDIKKSIYNDGFGIKQAEGGRTYFETGVSFPMQASWMFFTPEIKGISLNYNLSNLNKTNVIKDIEGSYEDGVNSKDFSDSPSQATATFSLDSGLFFDRSTNLFGTNYTNTFEPRAKYLYVPYVEGQEFNPVFDTGTNGFSYSSLWQDNRFSGYDRIGDTNQLALGFTTRLIEDNGFERMRFGLGQIVYFKDRKVYIASGLGERDIIDPDTDDNYDGLDERAKNELTNSTSPLASEFIYNFTRTMSLRQDFSWNTNENRLDNYGLSYRWQPEKRKTLNVGMRYRDQVDRYVKNELDQNVADPNNPGKYLTTDNNLKLSDISFSWPVPYTQSWSGMGRWQHDFTNKRNLEQLAGVEYNSCCYQVRLFWRSWIEADDNIDHPDEKTGVFLQFVLRGLGDITGSSGSEYLQGIQGYETREK